MPTLQEESSTVHINRMIDAIINDLKKLKEELPKMVNSAVMEKEQEVLDINRDQMFKMGIDSQGNAIWPEYQKETIDAKGLRAQYGVFPNFREYNYEPIDHVALIQTGSFYGNMFIQQRSDHFVIWSRDQKTGMLVQKYGREIFGIAPENWDRFLTLVVPVIDRYLELRLKAYR